MPGKCVGIPSVPTPVIPTMQLCMLPQSQGRNSGRPLESLINLVIVTCNPGEICVESNSILQGNGLGYV